MSGWGSILSFRKMKMIANVLKNMVAYCLVSIFIKQNGKMANNKAVLVLLLHLAIQSGSKINCIAFLLCRAWPAGQVDDIETL